MQLLLPKRALLAQERSSAALERQADLAERLAGPRRPFALKALSNGPGDTRWLVTNNIDEPLFDVWVNTPEGLDHPWIRPDQPGWAVDLAPGESIGFTFVKRAGSPASAVVWIEYSPDRNLVLRQTHTVE